MTMMRLVGGLLRSVAESGATTIIDDFFLVVASGASGQNERNLADCTASTAIALPNSVSYTGDELEIYLNNIRLEDILDYNWVSTAPRTQISMTFNLVVGDRVRIRIDRAA